MKLSKKQIATLLVGSTLAMAAINANARALGFNDVYNIQGGSTISATKVLSGQLSILKNSPTSITVSEPSGVLSGGTFNIVAGTSATHQCQLTIQDVDFETPKLVAQKCVGGAKVTNFDADYTNVNIQMS